MSRLEPNDRRQQILEAAVTLAGDTGYRALTRDGVAEAAGVSAGLVTRYFYHVELLRYEVLLTGIKRELLPLVAEGLVAGESVALCAPEALRRRAVEALVGA